MTTNMNTYEAEINNVTGDKDNLELWSFQRPRLTPDIIRIATMSLFFHSADLGIYGEHLEAVITTDGDRVCTIYCDSFMDGSRVYADISIKRPEDKDAYFLRRMTIAD